MFGKRGPILFSFDGLVWGRYCWELPFPIVEICVVCDVQVNFLTSFNSASFPDSLALAKEGTLTIGSIDEIQKLHIQSVHLQEQPRRICHQPETKSIGVVILGLGIAKIISLPLVLSYLSIPPFGLAFRSNLVSSAWPCYLSNFLPTH